jgi:2,5-diamino-6-(ribosylamino)-4(3H)-pyrimidinone 5'-phosphate reductase
VQENKDGEGQINPEVKGASMLPYVILHMGISLDGRIDWGGGADNPYYELVEGFAADTDLFGSNTMLTGQTPEDPQKAFGQMYDDWMKKTFRPRLAVVDSRGRIKNWENILKQPWWSGYIALCSEQTPEAHLDYLQGLGVSTIVTGKHSVDLRSALEELNRRFNTQRVRVDSGGILNGVLLRQGLVDEVSVIISPSLVGGSSPRTMFVAPDLETEEDVVPLELASVGKIRERYVWLRYRVKNK